MVASAPGNETQAAFWSEAGGEAWVTFQDNLDRQLAPAGDAALAALLARPGESMLDIGCGCGATTIELAGAVGDSGRVVGLDISVPMTKVAAHRLAEQGLAHAKAIVGDAQIITPHDIGGVVDGVFSRFGVMFFDDPVSAFTNIRALTKESGRLVFVCWQEARRNRLFSDLGRELAALFPGQPAPDPRAPGPMALADANHVMSILTQSGWSQIEIVEHLAPMQLFGTTEFDVALRGSLFVGGAARLLNNADEATTTKIHDAARRVLASQWTDNGAVVESATWIVSARNEASN